MDGLTPDPALGASVGLGIAPGRLRFTAFGEVAAERPVETRAVQARLSRGTVGAAAGYAVVRANRVQLHTEAAAGIAQWRLSPTSDRPGRSDDGLTRGFGQMGLRLAVILWRFPVEVQLQARVALRCVIDRPTLYAQSLQVDRASVVFPVAGVGLAFSWPGELR